MSKNVLDFERLVQANAVLQNSLENREEGNVIYISSYDYKRSSDFNKTALKLIKDGACDPLVKVTYFPEDRTASLVSVLEVLSDRSLTSFSFDVKSEDLEEEKLTFSTFLLRSRASLTLTSLRITGHGFPNKEFCLLCKVLGANEVLENLVIGLVPKPEKRHSTEFIIYLTMAIDQRSSSFKTFGFWSAMSTRHLLEESPTELAFLGARLLGCVDVLEHFSFFPLEFNLESSDPFRFFISGLTRSNLGRRDFLNEDSSPLQWYSARLLNALVIGDGFLLKVFSSMELNVKDWPDFRQLEPPEPEPPPSFTRIQKLDLGERGTDPGNTEWKILNK